MFAGKVSTFRETCSDTTLFIVIPTQNVVLTAVCYSPTSVVYRIT
uniref:Uncharacterized protein n=1 Tax=Anguilla anguilla TaxID=7936 RepID=A0A0E9VKG8_ANGAN